jgi:hypothetical protein
MLSAIAGFFGLNRFGPRNRRSAEYLTDREERYIKQLVARYGPLNAAATVARRPIIYRDNVVPFHTSAARPEPDASSPAGT